MERFEMTRQPGDLIAERDDGSQLIYDYTSEDGFEIGHIVMEDGFVSPRQSPVLSILAHGYWRTPESTQP